MAERTGSVPNCFRCRGPILGGDMFLWNRGDWYHVRCAGMLSFQALYERMHRLVFTLTVRITNNRETAEELTLDVFHDVWRRAARYDPAGGAPWWAGS